MVDLYTTNPDAALAVAVVSIACVAALIRVIVVIAWGGRR